jgi:signal transduction histidine kinase
MRITRNGALLITLSYLCAGLFFFSYRYLEGASFGNWPDWRPIFINEMSGALATYILFWPLLWFTNRFPLSRGVLQRHLVLHLLAIPVWSFLQTSIMALVRPPFYLWVLGERFDYGYMPLRYLMEFSIGAFIFWAQVAAITAFRFQRELRLREVRTAQLERELTQAHLDALRLQLRPHFLFNALNAVSSVMYEDPRKADRMIASLSDFLRAVLRQESTETVPLEEEERLLQQYLSIMQVRFGERLRVTVDIPESLREALVPPLLLQPLVENCVQHGVDPESGRLDIDVRAQQRNGRLEIAVRDHGPGLGTATRTTVGSGLGLTNTRRRLERMYGTDQQFSLVSADGGGALATVSIPFKAAPGNAEDPALSPAAQGPVTHSPAHGERR